LQAYHAENDHCSVPKGSKFCGQSLGAWVRRQRNDKADGTLTAEREKKLTELGFDWAPLERQWEEGFRVLQAYQAENGHCRVSKSETFNGFKLGSWVMSQKGAVKKGALSFEREKRLNDIGFVWVAR